MSEDKRYAIKVMEKEHIKRKNMLDEILSERSIMAQIDCKYIVKLFYCLQVKFFCGTWSSTVKQPVIC